MLPHRSGRFAIKERSWSTCISTGNYMLTSAWYDGSIFKVLVRSCSAWNEFNCRIDDRRTYISTILYSISERQLHMLSSKFRCNYLTFQLCVISTYLSLITRFSIPARSGYNIVRREGMITRWYQRQVLILPLCCAQSLVQLELKLNQQQSLDYVLYRIPP